ncbi:MAG: ATP-binding protein [bacterium]|nr:ATP-binding protein [bacterium]
MNAKSRWYVITGGFSAGKSTVIDCLSKMGYETVPDAARVIIDEGNAQGKTTQEIRQNEQEFQRQVLARKLEAEGGLPKDQLTFLDRAVPCSIAYHALLGLDPQEIVRICERNLYAKIFMLAQLPYERDYARTETEEFMRNLNEPMRQAYVDLGYEVIDIPVVSPEERVKLILNHL